MNIHLEINYYVFEQKLNVHVINVRIRRKFIIVDLQEKTSSNLFMLTIILLLVLFF